MSATVTCARVSCDTSHVGSAVKTVPVTVGLVTGGRAEILKGLNEGETVIVRAGPFLRDGDAVSPVVEAAREAQR